MMQWASKYVGLPYIDRGRTFAGVDCWGLVYLIMRREKGIELPSYGDISAHELIKVTRTIRDKSGAEPWHPVNEPRAFDVALMRGSPLHVGLMYDDRNILHIEEKISAVFMPISHPAIAFRITGFRRHRELLDAA